MAWLVGLLCFTLPGFRAVPVVKRAGNDDASLDDLVWGERGLREVESGQANASLHVIIEQFASNLVLLLV
jgi:hypothetical protein